jgi:hypothetical protein
MGWLFAVAIGLQRQRCTAVLESLLPIAIGHALSVGVVVLAVSALRLILDPKALELAAALVLIGFGLYRLLARHRGRVGMQVSGAQLALWSFLMATAHGAGLMLLPVLLELPPQVALGEHAHLHDASVFGQTAGTAFAAVALHTTAMLVVAGAVAITVYRWVGLAFLRRGWINLDSIWIAALVGAGAILLFMALGPLG